MFSADRSAISAVDTDHRKNSEVWFCFLFNFPKGDYFRHFQNERLIGFFGGGRGWNLKSWYLSQSEVFLFSQILALNIVT